MGRDHGDEQRQLHLRPTAVAQVASGAFFGAAARDAIEQAITTPSGGIPRATLAINVVGAFLLGVVLEGLSRAGDDRGRRRSARLIVGTGFLGAFTTYSTFAVEADLLVRGAHDFTAVAYAAVTVIGGLVAVVSGVGVAAVRHGRSRATLPTDPDLDAEQPDGR